jgi:hypothetical protein
MFTRCQRFFLLIAPVAMVAACSQPANSLSPVAPSAVSVDAASSGGFGGWITLSTASAVDHALSSAAAAGRKNVSGVGTVAHLRGVCSATETEEPVSFTVQGVKVVTAENTEFFIDAQETAIEGGCGNLRNGTKVRVVADETPNADGSYTAQKVTIVDQPGGRPPADVAGEGVVGARKGDCPSLTMVVHGYPVMTTSFTSFAGGDCEAIAPGTRIKVEGKLGGNSVVADSVEILAATTTP